MHDSLFSYTVYCALLIHCFYLLGFEVTDNGVECVTPCGQDGLYEERYWCHTSDSWDFCSPQYKGQFLARVTLVTLCYFKYNMGKTNWPLALVWYREAYHCLLSPDIQVALL